MKRHTNPELTEQVNSSKTGTIETLIHFDEEGRVFFEIYLGNINAQYKQRA